ncbi:MAG TPA: hypothetical protein VMC78_06085 [Mycobacterium sp.]|nr:hypothetical protein [Mycobacterium sp.]HUB56791.1 hypothetical protein [Mycobacterium sp.]
MNSNRSRYIAGGLLAAGLSIGAAVATPVASADPSSDPWIDQLLSGLSLPAPAAALDMQVSIDGTDLFPTAGNTAAAISLANGGIAIAIGNGANAYADGGVAFADGANSNALVGDGGGDSAWVFGANSTAEAGFIGSNDSAWVFGDNSTADAGFGPPSSTPLNPFEFSNNYDFAAAFGDMLHATATSGSNMVDILPSL